MAIPQEGAAPLSRDITNSSSRGLRYPNIIPLTIPKVVPYKEPQIPFYIPPLIDVFPMIDMYIYILYTHGEEITTKKA